MVKPGYLSAGCRDQLIVRNNRCVNLLAVASASSQSSSLRQSAAAALQRNVGLIRSLDSLSYL